MSEFNPFGAAAEGCPAAPEATEADPGKRRNVVLGGVLAVAVLGAGAYLFLGGGGEEDVAFEGSAVVRTPRAAASPAASPAVVTLPVSSKVALGRNPFRALYVQPATAVAGPVAAPAAASGGSTAATGTGTTTTPVLIVDSGTSTPAGSGGSAPQQPAPAPVQPAPAAQSTVALKDVAAGKDGANPNGTFVYDGKEVSGAPGDVMAGRLLVLSLQQDATGSWFANLQLGDGSPFEVHERQTVVVQ